MCYIFETNNNYYYAYTFIFRSFLGIRKFFGKKGKLRNFTWTDNGSNHRRREKGKARGGARNFTRDTGPI